MLKEFPDLQGPWVQYVVELDYLLACYVMCVPGIRLLNLICLQSNLSVYLILSQYCQMLVFSLKSAAEKIITDQQNIKQPLEGPQQTCVSYLHLV